MEWRVKVKFLLKKNRYPSAPAQAKQYGSMSEYESVRVTYPRFSLNCC